MLEEPLKSITMPKYKFTFILASYAFQNLKDEDLDDCVLKCMDSLLTGGVLLLREPYPNDEENYFDKELQRIIRPKQTYIDAFEKRGGKLVLQKDHHYQHKYAPEFAIAFRRDSKMI